MFGFGEGWPVERRPGWARVVKSIDRKNGVLHDIQATLRGLPVPVVGRITEGALRLDVRCLSLSATDEAGFLGQLRKLAN